MWVPKYAYDNDILDLYYRTSGGYAELDPIVAAMSNDDLMDMMDDWDPTSMPHEAWISFDEHDPVQ